MNILITGATGFLGSYLVRELSPKFETVYLLSRRGKLDLFSEYENVKYVSGDITNLDVLAVDGNERVLFLDQIHVVVHAAALYDLSASYSSAFLHNVVGTQNILHLLNSMNNLKSFYYISTIAVGDPSTFFLEESIFPVRNKFQDAYSETKYLAEKIVRENLSLRYATRIIRPGIIIGDSKTGLMPKNDGPYYFLHAFEKYSKLLKYFPILPLSFNPKAKIPVIPVDHCARLMSCLIQRDQFTNTLKTYHLISLDCPSLKEFLDDLNIKFGLNAYYLPLDENVIHNTLLRNMGIPDEVLPFMFSRLSYDRTNTLEDLPEIKESSYPSFKHILFGKSQK